MSQTLHQGTGDVEMTGTCCLYSGSSMKVVTSGKDARELEDLKLLQWRFSKADWTGWVSLGPDSNRSPVLVTNFSFKGGIKIPRLR